MQSTLTVLCNEKLRKKLDDSEIFSHGSFEKFLHLQQNKINDPLIKHLCFYFNLVKNQYFLV